MPQSEPSPIPHAGARQRGLPDGRFDHLVAEEPLLLVIDGQRLLTMRTPGNDADLALGFLLGEGIAASAADLASLQFQGKKAESDQPDELHVTLRTALGQLARARLTRTHEIRGSCGICGSTDALAALDGSRPLLPGVPRVARTSISGWVAELRARQTLFAATGGSHAALVLSAKGDVLGFGEDVGRHNALDKAIGMASRLGADLSSAVAVLSGRAGFDLVIKCLRARIPVVVSVSAPSAAAFDLCQAAGATLLGFARGQQFVCYCGAQRLHDGR